MDILHQLDNIPSNFGRTVVSVGNFDGVHRAHAHVLCEIVRRARIIGAKAIAVTFEPHPARILRPDSTLKLLTPTPEKLRLLEATGLDAVSAPVRSRSFAPQPTGICRTHPKTKTTGSRSA